MGALRGLECPWLTGTGNHSMAGFLEFVGGRYQEVRVGSVHIQSFGIEAARDGFEAVFSRFAAGATLRVLGGYQANAPWRRVASEHVRLYYYGHELVRSVMFEEGGTTYLRKPDANSYFRVELGPPHTFEAPVKIERFTARRED